MENVVSLSKLHTSIDVTAELESVTITVGFESARRLSKILGREVKEGEQFTFAPNEENPFNDPRMNADLYPEF